MQEVKLIQNNCTKLWEAVWYQKIRPFVATCALLLTSAVFSFVMRIKLKNQAYSTLHSMQRVFKKYELLRVKERNSY